MQVSSYITIRIKDSSKVFIGIFFLVCGCLIYLLFRSKSLNIYIWSKAFGLSSLIDILRLYVSNWNIPNIVRYSLPDGLYCAAYILLIDAIWHKDKRCIRYIILSLVPILTISSEILQYYGLIKGTFDKYDLVCYLLPPIIYFTIKRMNNSLTKSIVYE